MLAYSCLLGKTISCMSSQNRKAFVQNIEIRFFRYFFGNAFSPSIYYSLQLFLVKNFVCHCHEVGVLFVYVNVFDQMIKNFHFYILIFSLSILSQINVVLLSFKHYFYHGKTLLDLNNFAYFYKFLPSFCNITPFGQNLSISYHLKIFL
jgi:hypothetical protein